MADRNTFLVFPIWRQRDKFGQLPLNVFVEFSETSEINATFPGQRPGVVLAKHVSFNNNYDGKIRQKMLNLFTENIKRSKPLFKLLTFNGESSKKAYYNASHFNLCENDENIANVLSFKVNWTYLKSTPIPTKLKKLMIDEFENKYPKEFKSKYYYAMKDKLLASMKYLDENIKKSNEEKEPLFVYKVRLRHSDMDQINHLNHTISFKFIYDALIEFNKKKSVNITEINIVFWKPITMKKNEYIYINISNINKTSNIVTFYGSIDVQRIDGKSKRFDKRQGFVVRAIMPKAKL